MWVKSITGKTIGDLHGWRVVIQYNKAREGYTIWARGAEANFPAYKTEDQAMRAVELWALLQRREIPDWNWNFSQPAIKA